jgi:hypothetical protein
VPFHPEYFPSAIAPKMAYSEDGQEVHARPRGQRAIPTNSFNTFCLLSSCVFWQRSNTKYKIRCAASGASGSPLRAGGTG